MSTDAPAPVAGSDAAARAWALAQMPLDRLREMRHQLQEEELRTSFWRRIIQGRLDMLDATDHVPLEPHRLARSLRDSESPYPRRKMFLRLTADQPFPTVGSMEDMESWSWGHPTPEQREQMRGNLLAVEAKVSKYREGIQRNLDLATQELIRRLHQNPAVAREILPKDLFA